MVELIFVESIIHLFTFLAVLFPLLIITSILIKEREELIISMLWIVLGLLPMAIYHLLEFLNYFHIELLPAEGTFAHSLISHGTVVIAFLSIGWFMYIFKKRYINPIYKN